MRPLGILTDASAYFIQPEFPGRDLISILPLDGVLDSEKTASTFLIVLQKLLQRYQNLLVVLHTAALSPLARLAQECVERENLAARVQIVDSGTFSLGLGLLVQHAAQKAAQDEPPKLDELALHIRRHTEEIYTLTAIPDFSFLEKRGMLRPSQALVAQVLNFTPVFNMENDQLVLMEKARNPRHLLTAMQDFLLEFSEVAYLALLPGGMASTNQMRIFRTFVRDEYPQTRFVTTSMPAFFQKSFGKQACGLIVVEKKF